LRARGWRRIFHVHADRLGQKIPALDVTGAGILANASGRGEAAKVVALFAMAFALCGLGFLATSLFTHAGRPSVGFQPTRADVAFVHDRLIKKESNAQVGSMLTGVGFVVLLVVIL